MCCRYYMEMNPELRPIVEEMNRAPLAVKMREKLGKPLTSEGEVRPTDIVPAIASAPSGTAKVYPMLWGFSARGAADRECQGGDGAPEAPLERGVGKAPLHHPRLVVLRMGASDLAVREAQNRRQVFDPAAWSGGLLHGRIVQA